MHIQTLLRPLTKLGLLILIFSSCGHEKNDSKQTEKSSLVSIFTVEAKDEPVSFEYVAQTQSSHLVNIEARVTGFLDKRVYTEGQMVKAGEVLFIMDKKPFQAQVDAAKAAVSRQEAALETARLNLARVKPLTELNALSQKDLDDAVGNYQTTGASLEQTKAQLVTAELNLSYCTIISPIDGITSSAQQQEGSYLNIADSRLTTVSAMDPIWVNFSLSEIELQNFRDQSARGELIIPEDGEFVVKVIQVNGQTFPHFGRITFREPYFNPQTGTFLIRANVANPDKILRPNQYLRAKIEGAIRPKAIFVPQKAVQESSKSHYVWVVNASSRAEQRPVNVGDWQGENWFITNGLQSGDRVVIDGGQRLYSGALVTIKSSEGRDGAKSPSDSAAIGPHSEAPRE